MKHTELSAMVNKTNKDGLKRGFHTPVSENMEDMTKEELATIVKELDYIIGRHLDIDEYNEVIGETLESIRQQEVFEVEEEDDEVEWREQYATITDILYEAIMQVKETGMTNMFSVRGVQEEALKLGTLEGAALALHLSEKKNHAAYSRFILRGDRGLSGE